MASAARPAGASGVGSGGEPPETPAPPRVAVIGSGLAGLTTAWLLGKCPSSDGRSPADGSSAGEGGPLASGGMEVELYEAAPSLGMGTHSVALDPPPDGDQKSRQGSDKPPVMVDIPPRFVVPSYYSELLQLYKAVGVPFYMSSGDGCFQTWGADESPYFRFGNVRMFGVSLPYVWAAPWSTVAWRIVWDLLRFRWRARRHLREGSLIGLSFGEYLSRDYSPEFGERFAVPMLCVVCTCSPEAVRAYPADTLVEYWLCWALRGDGLFRATGGTHAVVSALSAGLAKCHLGTRVTAVRATGDGAGGGGAGAGGSARKGRLAVLDERGEVRYFDHVVLATQAKFAAELLDGYLRDRDDRAGAKLEQEQEQEQEQQWGSDDINDERGLLRAAQAALGRVRSEAAEMVLHGDARAMPSRRRAWSAMNVFVSPDRAAVSCTAWQPAIEGGASSVTPCSLSI
eukprot:COSAG01_NODE_2074_length_8491_cov_4.600024_13_plen_456_part_00